MFRFLINYRTDLVKCSFNVTKYYSRTYNKRHVIKIYSFNPYYSVKYYRPFHSSYFPCTYDTQWTNYRNFSYRCIFCIWMIMSTAFLNILYTCIIGIIPYMDMVRLIKFIWLMSNEDNYVNKKLINLINNLFSAKKSKYALVGWPLSSPISYWQS